jgi:hypothetical protein
VVLDPAVDTPPRVANRRWRGQALVEVLHLDLAIGALVERVRVHGGLTAQGATHSRRVGGAGRHGTLGGADEAIAGRELVVLVGRVQVGAGLGAARRDGGEGSVAALGNGDVTAGAVRRVVRGVAVVRGHGVPEVLQGRSYSGQMLAMSANVVVVVCAGGGAREACEACEAGVSYCCAMVSTSLGGSGTAKRAYGCALRCQPVGGVPGLSECRVLVAGSSGLGRVLWFGKRWQELGLGIEKTDSR